MIVLDASAAVELLLATPGGQEVRTRIDDPDQTLHAPHLIDIEVTQALRRYTSAGQIDPDHATRALELFGQLDISRYPHDLLLPRIWALRANMTAYDGAYVALAESLGATLLTFDAKLARAPGLMARIETP